MEKTVDFEHTIQADHGDKQLDDSEKRLVLLARLLVGIAFVMLAGGMSRGPSEGNIFQYLNWTFFYPSTTLTYSIVGLTILSRQPRHGIGWLMAAISFFSAFNAFYPLMSGWMVSAAGGTAGPFLGVLIAFLSVFWMATNYFQWVLIPLYFPSGKLISKRYHVFVTGTLVSLMLVMIAMAIAPMPIDGSGELNRYGIEGTQRLSEVLAYAIGAPLLLIGLLGGLYSFIVRYRQGNDVERSQIKMLIYLLVISILIYAFFPILGNFLPEESFPAFDLGILWSRIYSLLIPITFGVAILRHNLWDIDLVINRTLVYGGLSFLVIVIYLAVVSGSALLFQTPANPYSGLIAAGIIAVIFQPVREWLQNRVNRLVYGERDNPAAVLARLAHHSETAEDPADVLPNLARTIADLLKIPYVAIRAHTAPLVSWGQLPAHTEAIPLIFQNQTIGELVVASRSPSENFTQTERELLATIAALTATTVRSVQLTNELRRSRQRIVTAREEERRRLRRDLHDDLGPQLASQTLGLEAVSQLIPSDPRKAQALLDTLKRQAEDAFGDLRSLVYDLRPPVLDNQGLLAALRQNAARFAAGDLQIEFDVPEALPELPAAVEAAAYRIALEAITNVSRHAQASHCVIGLSCTAGQLVVEVRDNGRGLPPDLQVGIGIQAMRERTSELTGTFTAESLPVGGVRVHAILPLEVVDE